MIVQTDQEIAAPALAERIPPVPFLGLGVLLSVLAYVLSLASFNAGLTIKPGGGPDYSQNWISVPANLVVSFIFTSSVVVNALLIVRTPATLLGHALPRSIVRKLVILYSFIGLWLVAGVIYYDPSDYDEIPEILFVLLGAGIAVVSIMIAVGAVRHRRQQLYVPRRESVDFSVRTRVLLVLAAVIIIGLTLVSELDIDSAFHPFTSAAISGGSLGAGLPWSPALTVVVALVGLGWQFADAKFLDAVLTNIHMLLPGTLNVAVIVVSLISGRFRTGLVNWFFRLGKQPRSNRAVATADPAGE